MCGKMKKTQNTELFQRVEAAAKFFAGNVRAFTTLIGFNYRTFYGYLNAERQDNLWPILPELLEKFPRLSRQWLYFNEGPMLIGQGIPLDKPVPIHELAAAAEAIAADCGGSWGDVLKIAIGHAGSAGVIEDAKNSNIRSLAPVAMPLMGFASCGKEGWGGRMTYPVPVEEPHGRPGMVAVMATGESMIPEGIGHGMVCFCDPNAPPMPGECVYVEKKDGTATLKRFLGGGQMEGGGEAIRLQGWTDMQDGKAQEPFVICIDQEEVTTIAPVIYIQRRR